MTIMAIDAEAVLDAVRILRDRDLADSDLPAVWCQRASAHLLGRLDKDLRGGSARSGVQNSDDVRVLVLLEALKAAGDALLEAAKTLKDRANLPLLASRAHQAGQRALTVHRDLDQG